MFDNLLNLIGTTTRGTSLRTNEARGLASHSGAVRITVMRNNRNSSKGSTLTPSTGNPAPAPSLNADAVQNAAQNVGTPAPAPVNGGTPAPATVPPIVRDIVDALKVLSADKLGASIAATVRRESKSAADAASKADYVGAKVVACIFAIGKIEKHQHDSAPSAFFKSGNPSRITVGQFFGRSYGFGKGYATSVREACGKMELKALDTIA